MLTLTIIAVILAVMFLAACYWDKPKEDGKTPRITHEIINDKSGGDNPHAPERGATRVRFLMRPSTGDPDLVSGILHKDFGFPEPGARISASGEKLEVTVTREPEEIISILTHLWAAGVDAAVTQPHDNQTRTP